MPVETLPRLEDCNCFAVRSAARHVGQFYDQFLAPIGLRTTQFSILAKLKQRGPLTINALAKDMVMDRTTLGRNVLPLERDGLIRIEPIASDRRAKELHLTNTGEKRLQAALKAWSPAQAQFETTFGTKRAGELRALLRSVVVSFQGVSMSNDIFDYSVPVFLRGHGILAELLKKAESHAAERKIAPAVLLTARLFPDMYPLTRQVQAACDTAKRATARLVGEEAPRFEDNEVSFDELHARIRKTTEFVEAHPADAFLAAADRTIEMKMGSGTVSLTASQYLTRFALPNFYFHVTTAYDILRHNGVALGKRDYIGNMAS